MANSELFTVGVLVLSLLLIVAGVAAAYSLAAASTVLGSLLLGLLVLSRLRRA